MHDRRWPSGPSSARPTCATPSVARPSAGPSRSSPRAGRNARPNSTRSQQHLGEPVRDLRLYERAEARVRPGRANCTRPIARARTSCAGCRISTACGSTTPRRPRASCSRRRTAAQPAQRALRAAITALRRLDAGHLRDLQRDPCTLRAPLVRPGTTRCSPGNATTSSRSSRPPASSASPAATSPCCSIACGCSASAAHCAPGRSSRGPRARWPSRERVVLFHDHPPQGAGNAELFEAGLGLVPGTVFLPHAATRLALDDPQRVALLARRLAPAAACTLDDGDQLHWRRGRLVRRRRVAASHSQRHRRRRLAPNP